MESGIEPTNPFAFIFSAFTPSAGLLHATAVHVQMFVIGEPFRQFQPSVNVPLLDKAAAKSHIANRSGSTVGDDVGWPVGATPLH
jgi:hypothetical protein